MKLAIAALLGFLAPLWWSWAAGVSAYLIYLASGSPKEPSQVFMWASLHAPSLVIGFATGLLTALLRRDAPLLAWAAFAGGFVAASVVFTFIVGDVDYLGDLYLLPGTWLFLAGTLAWPGFVAARARRSPRPEPAQR